MSYKTVRIPAALAEKIDQFIEDHEGLGYKSRAQVCIDGARRIMEAAEE